MSEMKGNGPKLIKLVAAPSDDATAPGRRPGRICYVDDSRTSAYVTKKILTEFGYYVDHFNSAEPAIVALLENDYDLLLTDLLLSTGGMNGDDLVRFLRMSGHPKKKLLPVIVITGSSDKDTLLQIYEAGANGVLVKPITGEELNERIRGLIPEYAPVLPQSGYALEIHDEPGPTPETPAPAARKPPPATAGTTENPPGARKASAPPAAARAPGPVFKRAKPPTENKSQTQSPPRAPPADTPPVKPRPVTAFGAKKRLPPPVSGTSSRDAAAVIAELRASDRHDEDIPTLTLAFDTPNAEAPVPPRPISSEAKSGRDEGARAAKVAAAAKPVLNVVSAVLDTPAAPAGKTAEPPKGRAPAREPERGVPPGSKSILTALDIEQDFLPLQDESIQPSMTRTVIETAKHYKILSVAALISLIIIGWSVASFMNTGGSIDVETARAEIGALHQAITVPGKVVSKLKVDVNPTAAGEVKQLFVKEGDKVRKGQNLAQLENDEVSNEVKRAEGNLQTTREETVMAEKTVTRMRRALDLGAVSRQAVEESEATLKSVKAKETAAKELVRSTKQLLDKLMVTAPFEGTITARQVQVGQYARPSDPIVTVVDLTQREIETKVDAADSAVIAAGQEVEMSSDAFPGRKWRETVIRVAPSANRETTANTVNVYISLGKDAPALKVGQQVDADIRIVSAEHTIKVPVDALIQRNGKTWVAVIEAGRAHFIPVTTGMEDLTHAEITQGIRPGQEVILPKGAILNEGDQVNVVSESS